MSGALRAWGIAKPHRFLKYGVWRQTARMWGNGRTIYGVAHMVIGNEALCGYVPHEKVRLVASGGVARCERCEKRYAKLADSA